MCLFVLSLTRNVSISLSRKYYQLSDLGAIILISNMLENYYLFSIYSILELGRIYYLFSRKMNTFRL